MKKSQKWKTIPVEDTIFKLLIKNRGEMLSTDLYRQLSNEYRDFHQSDFNKYLFKLEVRSFIHVTQIKKGVQNIGINRYANLSNDMMRQVRKFMH